MKYELMGLHLTSTHMFYFDKEIILVTVQFSQG